eukprot:TRINITY_DN24813_c0_g2_i1.p1 TRINITY_DN24813_c0_g2~~TRINITY_DN24813_c0_g2_i1.p1  ORF type:complete len:384 (+),score=61.20 TRINITY_DN24813_c0_g2_i1:134-1285(+)
MDTGAARAPSADRSRWLAGVVCICFVAIVWTLATVLKQIVFNDLAFDEPLVLAYVCNACYIVHLPVRALRRCVSARPLAPSSVPLDAAELTQPQAQAISAVAASDDVAVVARRTAIRAGIIISPIWFLAQYTYSRGVATTSVTSSTLISTTSVVWTLLASVLFLGERLSALKIFGVLACMLGNVATLWGGDAKGGQGAHFSGDILCVLAAMLYAAYTTVLRRLTGEDVPVTLLFGTLGAAVLVMVTPLALAVRWQALRNMSVEVFGLLLFNGLFDNVLSQFAWAKAVQWTSPTAATVGLSLTIPLSVVADLIRGTPLTGWSFVSMGLVLAGFFAVTFAACPDAEEETGAASMASCREGGILVDHPLEAVDCSATTCDSVRGDI